MRSPTLALPTLCLTLLLAVESARGQSRVTELNEAGWKALQEQRSDVAARLFAEALALRPNDAVLMFGAGAAEFVQGRLPDALWRLRRAVEIDAGLTEASRLLGEILYRTGDIDGAIAAYEQALKHAPKDAGLQSALALWRKETAAHGTFIERRDQLFTILYEGRQEEATAAQATTLLRAAFRRITEKLGVSPA